MAAKFKIYVTITEYLIGTCKKKYLYQNKKYLTDHRCGKRNMTAKCKIFVNVTSNLIDISIVYRSTYGYNFEGY